VNNTNTHCGPEECVEANPGIPATVVAGDILNLLKENELSDGFHLVKTSLMCRHGVPEKPVFPLVFL